MLFAFWLQPARECGVCLLDRQSDDSVNQCRTSWVVCSHWNGTLASLSAKCIYATSYYCIPFGWVPPQENRWLHHSVIFYLKRRPSVAGIGSLYWCSMHEWARAVSPKCSHLELNPRALSFVWTKSNGIWHRVRSQASKMKPTPSCEDGLIAGGWGGGISPSLNIYQDRGTGGSSHQLPLTTTEQVLLELNRNQTSLAWS